MKNILIIILFSITVKMFAADINDPLLWEASKPTQEQHNELVNILWDPLITKQLNDENISLHIDFNNVLYIISATNPNTCPLVMEIFKYFYETKFADNTKINFTTVKMKLTKTENPSAIEIAKKLPETIRTNIRNKVAIADINLEEIKILKEYEFNLSNVDLEKNTKSLQTLLNGCFVEELDQLNKTGSADVSQIKKSYIDINNRYNNSSRSPKDMEKPEDPADKQVPKGIVEKK